MKLECRLLDDVAVLNLNGPLDCGKGDRELKKMTDDLARYGYAKVVVNLSAVSHMDTTCLGLLIAAHVHFNRLGGALHLCGASARIQLVMKIAKLDDVLRNFSTEDEAVAAFSEAQSNKAALRVPVWENTAC